MRVFEFLVRSLLMVLLDKFFLKGKYKIRVEEGWGVNEIEKGEWKKIESVRVDEFFRGFWCMEENCICVCLRRSRIRGFKIS